MGKNSWNPLNWFNKDEKNSNIGDMSGMLNGVVSTTRNAMDVTNGRSSANMGELKMIEGGRGVEVGNSQGDNAASALTSMIEGAEKRAQSLVNPQGLGWKSENMNFGIGEVKKSILFSVESLGLEMPEEMQGRINPPGIHSMSNSNNGLPKMHFVEDEERSRVKEERSLAAEAARKRREAEKIQMSVDNKKRIDDWNSMNSKTLASQESALEKRPEMNEKRKQENLIRTESAKRLEEEEREKVYQEMNELSGNKIIARRGELINEGNNGIYDPQRIQEQAVIERILSERTDVFTENLRNMKKIIKEKGYTAGREDIEACIRNIEQERRKIEQSDESGLFNYALEKQPSLFEAIMSAPAIWLDLKSLNFPGKTSSDMMIARYESEKFRIELEGEEYKDLTPSVRDSARDFYYVLQLGGPTAVEKFFGQLSGTAKKREAIGPFQSKTIDIVHDKIFENMSGVMFEREETQEKLKELSIYGAQSVDSFVKAKVAMTLETMESEGHMPD